MKGAVILPVGSEGEDYVLLKFIPETITLRKVGGGLRHWDKAVIRRKSSESEILWEFDETSSQLTAQPSRNPSSASSAAEVVVTQPDSAAGSAGRGHSSMASLVTSVVSTGRVGTVGVAAT